MYYYGYNGGYSAGNSMYYNTYPTYTSTYGYGAAFILVLFILLVIIFGVGFINNNNFNEPNHHNCCGN